MECLTPPHNPHSSTQKTLPHHHNKPMKNLQDFVFKLAQAHPNAPLPPPAETLLRDRLQCFVSRYRTPEHPPYSAMIQNALQELNEKGGSSEESVSRCLDKKYDNLPWAHPVLLKHHLEETCESGDIVVTRTKKYRLAGSLNLSTKSKSKPRQRRCRWECIRRKHDKLKIRFRKKRTQQRGERAKVDKKHQECDDKEQRLTGIGVHGEHKQDQTKNLLSCVDEEKSSRSNPTISPTETPGMIAAANERKSPEEVRSQLENAPPAISESDIWDAHTQEHQEKEQSEHVQPELPTPERPPGFESVIVENLPELGSTESEKASAGEVIGSLRILRQLKCWSKRYSEPRAVTVSSSELLTPPKAGEYDSLQSEHNMETPQNQQQALDLVPITLKQTHHDNQQPQLIKTGVKVTQSITEGTKLTRDGERGLGRNNKLKEHLFEPYMTIDSSKVRLTSNESEFTLSTEQELAQQPQSQETFQGKQLSRSPRARLAKPEVAKDANTLDVLPPECFREVPPVKFCRRLGRPLKQRPSNQPPPKPKNAASVDAMQDQPKSKKQRMLLKQKPNAAAVVDDCREQDFQQSGKLSECTPMYEKMEPDAPKLHLQEALKNTRCGGQPKHRSDRLLKIKKKHG